MVLFITLTKSVLTFESVDEILKCDHSGESYLTVFFPCGAVYFSIFFGVEFGFGNRTNNIFAGYAMKFSPRG